MYKVNKVKSVNSFVSRGGGGTIRPIQSWKALSLYLLKLSKIDVHIKTASSYGCMMICFYIKRAFLKTIVIL
jgi:hypothetical protein